MIWGQYLIYNQTSFEALWSPQNISIKFFILSILSVSEEFIFLLYASIFKSFREHDKRIQYYKQNLISLGGRTSYPLPSSLCLFDSLCLSLFLLWRVCHTGHHSAVQPCPPTSELSVLTFLRDRHTLV